MSTYIFPMMRGNNYVRNIVGNYLQAHMPPYIDLLRSQNDDLNEINLPYPAQYQSSDPFDTESHAFPIVGTYFPNADNFNNVQLRRDGSTDYEIRYSATLFVTVRTPLLGVTNGVKQWATRADTIKMRDDLVAVMRGSILASPSFGTADKEYRVLAAYETIREAYPEPMKMNGQTSIWICSGLINVDIDAIETVSNPIIGTVSGFNVDAEKIPFD